VLEVRHLSQHEVADLFVRLAERLREGEVRPFLAEDAKSGPELRDTLVEYAIREQDLRVYLVVTYFHTDPT